MGRRHKKIEVDLPDWVDAASPCLRSVAEDVYYAKALARGYGAESEPSCRELMATAAKSLAKMENPRIGEKVRCHEGDRAARKFWEAKVCACG